MNPAVAALLSAAGPGADPVTGWSPGRCTLVGEHVDYAGGVAVCVAITLGVDVAVRVASGDGFVVTSDGVTVRRSNARPAGDIGDRALAPVAVLRGRGIDVPDVEVGIAATLPAGAGLASSAALIVATTVALARLCGIRMTSSELAGVALEAERDVVGIPCGPLDQGAVIEAADRQALAVDCRSGAVTRIAWPWVDAVLCVCDTGEHHDVGGVEYSSRRDQTLAGLATLGVASCQEVTDATLVAGGLSGIPALRVRHAMEESRRATLAADAIRGGDLAALGELMSASHASLRDLHQVSTPLLDAVVAAAEAVPGCAGARLVGAGFGGAAVALAAQPAAHAVIDAMRAACGGGHAWVVRPGPGVAMLAPDVIRG